MIIGLGFKLFASKNAPGLKGPGDLFVTLSGVSDVPSGAIANGLFSLKASCASIKKDSFRLFFSDGVSSSLSDSGVCTTIFDNRE